MLSGGDVNWYRHVLCLFGLADVMGQCSFDHVLIVPELRGIYLPSLLRRLSPYVQRLSSGIADVKAFPRSAHVAVLIPTYVFSDLVMDDEFSIHIHKCLCEA